MNRRALLTWLGGAALALATATVAGIAEEAEARGGSGHGGGHGGGHGRHGGEFEFRREGEFRGRHGEFEHRREFEFRDGDRRRGRGRDELRIRDRRSSDD